MHAAAAAATAASPARLHVAVTSLTRGRAHDRNTTVALSLHWNAIPTTGPLLYGATGPRRYTMPPQYTV